MKELERAEALAAGAQPRVQGWSQCRAMLSGPELVSNRSHAGVTGEPSNNLLLMDGEVHQAARRVVMSYFTRVHLERVEQRLERTCQALVASVLDKPGADLIAELAEPLVLEGILSVMEVPDEHRAKLSELTRGMLGLLEPDLPEAARRRATNAALRATLVFERDGAAGRATGMHAALEDAAREGLIPVKLARSTPVVMLHGGYENPLNQLGCVIAWAVAHPARFRAAAQTAPRLLFEEVLRVYSPVRLVARWATTGGLAGDSRYQPGDLVWVDLESANRDPDQFSAPDELELSHKRNHLGFGHGRHMCPGAALARLEGQALIRSLLALPDGQFHQLTVQWRDGVVARGPMTIARR